MELDLWGDMLLFKATKEEFAQIKKFLTVKIYKQQYILEEDLVSIEEHEQLVSASLEDDYVYGIAYPSALPYFLSLKPVLGERLKKKLEQLTTQLIEVKERVKLRDYQQEAVNYWLEERLGVVGLPTGSGKTIVAIDIISQLRCKTIIFVPTRTLVLQWYERLKRYFKDVGVYPDNGLAPITITTYQQFRKASIFNEFGLAVFDEGHHLPADKWWSIAKRNLFPYRLILTATPYRQDKNHRILLWYVKRRAFIKKYDELAREGWLAPLDINVIIIPPRNKERLLQLYELYNSLRGVSKRTASIKAQIRRLEEEDENKDKLIRYLVDKHRNDKILIFTDYLSHAQKLAKLLHSPKITGQEDDKERKLAIEQFKKQGRLILTSAGEEGLDLPDANVLIMLNVPTPLRLIQRIGRVARPKPKAYVYILLLETETKKIKKLNYGLFIGGIHYNVNILKARGVF